VAAEADEREQAILRLERALRAVVEDERTGDWADLGTGRQVLAELRTALRDVRAARAARATIPSEAPTLPDAAVASLRGVTGASADAGAALLELARLRTLAATHRVARERHALAQRMAVAAERAAEIAEHRVEQAIDSALNDLNSTIGDFYTRLIGSSPYGDVKLRYQHRRAGGVDFSFVWDGTGTVVSPPQRIMSESQLGALGLAVFLARLKVRPPQWRTMALDDVVASFDVVHRTRLVRLLDTEFSEWQVILCTHDHQLSRVISEETHGWCQVKVASWSPSDGTTFGEADPRKRLRELLDAGRAADELGGLARVAMEQALERPVRKMGLRIRHDPSNRYSADEYRRALLEGLRDGDYVHADHQILKRLATDGSVTNRACHFKAHEPGVTDADLRLLLEDLDDLDALFHCGRCDSPAWDEVSAHGGRCRCRCGDLALRAG
jgi:hypothetical protein